MKLIGESPINPIIFYSGKIAGYTVWLLFFTELFSITGIEQLNMHKFIALFLAGISLIIIIISLIYLGSSISLGLPQEETKMKTHGLYSISRNPMYLGFNMLTMSAVLYNTTYINLMLGLYSVFTYHLIILAEEKFLENRFGKKYLDYKNSVRRYL